MQKRIKLIFILYIIVLIKLIVFKYPYGQLMDIAHSWRSDVILEGLASANFTPFKTIRMYIDYADRLNSFENLAGNVLAFIPFGMLLPLLNSKNALNPNLKTLGCVFLNAFAFVSGIELFQLFSAFGAFDVDDIILNCLGACIGFAVYAVYMDCRPVCSSETD